MEIVDGHKKEEHVSARKIADTNIAIFGPGDYVLEVGRQFAYEVVTNNTVEISDGVGISQGVRFYTKKNKKDIAHIDNGTKGKFRHDLIVAKYRKDITTLVESFDIEVLKGVPADSADTAVDPKVTVGNLRDNDVEHDVKLYRVRLNGLSIEGVDTLFKVRNFFDQSGSAVDQESRKLIKEETKNRKEMDKQIIERYGGSDDNTVKNSDRLGGYAPSYFASDAELDTVRSAAENAQKTADRARPLFAGSIAECKDTDRLYVLPDGYIYEYRYVEANVTNWLTKAVDASGNPYNGGTGYKSGFRLNSTGEESAMAGMNVTGFIPVKNTDIIRTAKINFTKDSNTKLMLFKADKSLIGFWQGGGGAAGDIWQFIKNVGMNLNDLTVNLATAPATGITTKEAAFIRFSCGYMDSHSVLALNQDPYAQGGSKWVNTGMSYNAPDYEDRIIAIEEQLGTIKGAPAYVIKEAKRVADIVLSRRTENSFSFAAADDFHTYAGSKDTLHAKTLLGIEHIGMGLEEIRKHASLDMAAFFGDYTWGDNTCTAAQIKKDIDYVKDKTCKAVHGIPNIWMTGNHDINYQAGSERRLTPDEMYAYIGSNNVGAVTDPDNLSRNYGYVDFDNKRIRAIYLNTVDSLDYPDNTTDADNAGHITATQLQWVVNHALDFTGKDAVGKWGILLMSHQPLSDYGTDVLKVLEAYKAGTNGSLTINTNGKTETVNYSFSGKTRASIIASFHGHMHNFRSDKVSASGTPWLWRIGIPNVCASRDNEVATSGDTTWAQKYGEFDGDGNPVYYHKTANSAEDTSFNIITIDRKNRKIYASCYGAGYDREFSY